MEGVNSSKGWIGLIRNYQEPQLDPVYQAARSYLEINQRVSLLNQRLDVIGDLVTGFLSLTRARQETNYFLFPSPPFPLFAILLAPNAQGTNVSFAG